MTKKMFQKTTTICLSAVAFLLAACSAENKKVSYEFTTARRGIIERTVSSSGKINPVSTVRVLPQMSGKVEKIYVDYNDTVTKGDVLAELNTDVLKLRREQQYASVIKARANYELQLLNYTNQQALAEKNLISDYELRQGKTTLDSHAADLAVAEANLKEIETEINTYAYITSPIDGIVLDRTINVGDSVVDSTNSNSTSIFTLAENLREMQIEATVGELDIISIHTGQQVRFTLESIPGKTFYGVVETVRMVPAVSNNIVSYTVIVKVENQDGTLFPGMTCAVDFIVERSEDTLMVSNAALRYQPTSLSEGEIADMVFQAGLADMSEEQRQAAVDARAQAQQTANAAGGPQMSGTGLTGMLMGGGPGGGRRQQSGQGQETQTTAAVTMRNLWYVAANGRIEVTRVRTGISDGSFTEVYGTENSGDIETRQFILRERI